MNGNVIGTAIPTCFFCNKNKNEIIMNCLLTANAAAKVTEMHNKIVDMQPCRQCEEWMRRGILLISIRDNEKLEGADWKPDPTKGPTGTTRPIPNPYRTGGWAVITDEAFLRVMGTLQANSDCVEAAQRWRWMFIEDSIWCMLGLPKFYPGQYVTAAKGMTLHAVDGEQSVEIEKDDKLVVVAEDGRDVYVMVERDDMTFARMVQQIELNPVPGKSVMKVDEERFRRIIESVNTRER